MEEIAISKFKATCLAVLEKVKKTGQPVLVTRFGQPIAQIIPPVATSHVRKLGTLAGTAASPAESVATSALEALASAERNPPNVGPPGVTTGNVRFVEP